MVVSVTAPREAWTRAGICLASSCSVGQKQTAGLGAEAQHTPDTAMPVPRHFPMDSHHPASSQLGRFCAFGMTLLLQAGKGRDRRARLTYCDSVDGVGVSIVVAVVTVLAPIATGHHEDAPKAPATCDHPVLQGSLWREAGQGALPRSFQTDPSGF